MAFRYHAAHDDAHYAGLLGIAKVPAPADVDVGGQGVFVRRPRADHVDAGTVPPLEATTGRWGLIPLFSPDGQDRLTHEAASETAATERNFLQPWKRGHRCVIVARALFDRTADGRTVRIARAEGEPFCIAGLWNGWRSPEGACVESFAMLTIDARDDARLAPSSDHLPLRLPVVLPDAWIDEWFHAPVAETATFLRSYPLQSLVIEPFANGA